MLIYVDLLPVLLRLLASVWPPSPGQVVDVFDQAEDDDDVQA